MAKHHQLSREEVAGKIAALREIAQDLYNDLELGYEECSECRVRKSRNWHDYQTAQRMDALFKRIEFLDRNYWMGREERLSRNPNRTKKKT